MSKNKNKKHSAFLEYVAKNAYQQIKRKELYSQFIEFKHKYLHEEANEDILDTILYNSDHTASVILLVYLTLCVTKNFPSIKVKELFDDLYESCDEDDTIIDVANELDYLL